MRVVSVTQVRRALYFAAGGPGAAQGDGAATLPLLGRLFHASYEALTGPDPRRNLARPLEQADASLTAWQQRLRAHVYAWQVAPALVEHAAELASQTAAVLGYWAAMRELADWLAQVMWEQDPTARRLDAVRAEVFEAAEREVAIELHDPAWAEPVRVEGRLDALLRQPATGACCVVELKTGRTAPDADLCQAALYRMLLASEGRQAQVAVVSFAPARHEQRFLPAQMVQAERALHALVGRLAGVTQADAPAVGTAFTAASPVQEQHHDLGRRVVKVLMDLGIQVALDGEPLVGPTFLRFFVKAGKDVRARQLSAVAQDVWMRVPLARPPYIFIVAGRIAIDVQRPDRQTVSWSADLRPRLPARSRAGCSRFPVGVGVDGGIVWADLADPVACHFLVAGTTGSGKSEWLRALLASLLATNRRETLRLVLIDPKRVAFRVFEGAPCLWRDVVYPDEHDVATVLDGLIEEMEQRYAQGVSDLAGYNASAAQPLPRIVCVCDEFADLLDGVERKARQALEQRVRRLGNKARGCGIHLVFATQRPSADLVRGPIRSNLVARVALRVDSALNSRLILEQPGAENLLGRGDLLYRSVGDPVRLQSGYVTEAELRDLVG